MLCGGEGIRGNRTSHQGISGIRENKSSKYHGKMRTMNNKSFNRCCATVGYKYIYDNNVIFPLCGEISPVVTYTVQNM